MLPNFHKTLLLTKPILNCYLHFIVSYLKVDLGLLNKFFPKRPIHYEEEVKVN